eukprot:2849483-Lingulodinium_polyedra.AAC.1
MASEEEAINHTQYMTHCSTAPRTRSGARPNKRFSRRTSNKRQRHAPVHTNANPITAGTPLAGA